MKRLLGLSLIIVSVFSLFLFSCKKNINEVTPEPGQTFSVPSATPVTGSVAGRVTDENDAAVTGAVINCGGVTAVTNSNGVFNFDNLTLDKYISTVTITKAGYYKGIRSFSANATKNYVEIKLIPKVLSGTFASSGSGTITLTNSTQINFQSNSIIVKSTGAAYTGTVNVYANYIDPTRSDIGSIVPGSFMARNGNSMYVLQSAGMIAVDLESPAGEALQLATNKPANIKLPIPASLVSNAPSTIDTWSLDDKGVWVKEGTATKVGTNYEMQVSHFSFWNCDVPANAVYLSLHVENQNGVSLRNALINLRVPNNNTWWASTYGRTDSSGNVSGLVPAGLPLTLNLLAGYNCTPSFTQNIGPFSTDASLTIVAAQTAAQTYTVTGTATACSGNLDSARAYIYLSNGNYAYTNVVNGTYSYTFSSCSTPSSVYVSITKGNLFNSTTQPFSGNSVTIPSLQVCQPANTTAIINGCQIVGVTGNFVPGVPLNLSNRISLSVNVVQPGTYTITTNTENGVRFSLSGNLPTAGQNIINLSGVGTPLAAGTFTYTAQYQGISGCSAPVTFSTSNPNTPALFNLGCNITTTGSLLAGVPVNGSMYVTIPVTVNTAGYYSISSNSANGVAFQDSGYFQAPGMYNVNVMAYGTPTSAGPSTFTFTGVSGTTTCSLNITTQFPTAGSFTFQGAGDTCRNYFSIGSYTAGQPVNVQNYVGLSVNVLAVGNYTITTNSVNGMTFSRTGTFTTTGIQLVTLFAGGTPLQSGNFTFNFTGNPAGCSFIVPVN